MIIINVDARKYIEDDLYQFLEDKEDIRPGEPEATISTKLVKERINDVLSRAQALFDLRKKHISEIKEGILTVEEVIKEEGSNIRTLDLTKGVDHA